MKVPVVLNFLQLFIVFVAGNGYCPTETECVFQHTNSEEFHSVIYGRFTKHKIRKLTIKNSNYREIIDAISNHLPNLKVLRVFNCKLKKIDETLFENLHWLRKIDLTANEISVIEPGAFRHLRNLEHLILDNNEIKSLHKSKLFGLHNLKSLSIKNNVLDNLSGHLFRHLINLENLDLSHNKLTTLDKNQFNVNLKSLNVANNQIEEISVNFLVINLKGNYEKFGMIIPDVDPSVSNEIEDYPIEAYEYSKDESDNENPIFKMYADKFVKRNFDKNIKRRDVADENNENQKESSKENIQDETPNTENENENEIQNLKEDPNEPNADPSPESTSLASTTETEIELNDHSTPKTEKSGGESGEKLTESRRLDNFPKVRQPSLTVITIPGAANQPILPMHPPNSFSNIHNNVISTVQAEETSIKVHGKKSDETLTEMIQFINEKLKAMPNFTCSEMQDLMQYISNMKNNLTNDDLPEFRSSQKHQNVLLYLIIAILALNILVIVVSCSFRKKMSWNVSEMIGKPSSESEGLTRKNTLNVRYTAQDRAAERNYEESDMSPYSG